MSGKQTQIGAGEKATSKGGRPGGKPNKSTRIIKEAAILAAESVGEDGKGKDGLLGYLRTSAILERAAYLSFLGRLVPTQVAVSLPKFRRVDQLTMTLLENQALLKDRISAMRNGEFIKVIENSEFVPQGEEELQAEREGEEFNTDFSKADDDGDDDDDKVP